MKDAYFSQTSPPQSPQPPNSNPWNLPPPSPRLMTKRDTFIEKDVMMNIVMNIQVRV